MKDSFTQSMAWLHTWAGLVLGWLLFSVFLTGTLTVFDTEIGHWMRPEAHRVAAGKAASIVNQGGIWLRAERPNARRWFITMPNEREPAARLLWVDGTVRGERYLDPGTGDIFPVRATHGGTHFEDFHAQLHFEETWGTWIVSTATMALLMILVSGIVIHKRIFKDFFTFRPRARSQRSWLDAHNVAAVLALPFHIMIAYTGLVIEHYQLMPAGVQMLYGGARDQMFDDLFERHKQPQQTKTPAPMLPLTEFLEKGEAEWGADTIGTIRVDHPNDPDAIVVLSRHDRDSIVDSADEITFSGIEGQRLGSFHVTRAAHIVESSMRGLHYAEFGGSAVRWLYFVCGMAGSAMIATGLVLFTIKRRDRHAGETWGVRRFYALVEKINVAAIAGVVAASIAFFWINRLLPVEMVDRAWWEVAAFFAVWFATVPHALLRTARKAWIEQLGFAAVLCLLLPVLNGLTTQTHLLDTLPRGDWLIAGVDLTAFGCGLLLAVTAWRVGRRPSDIRDDAPASTSSPVRKAAAE